MQPAHRGVPLIAFSLALVLFSPMGLPLAAAAPPAGPADGVTSPDVTDAAIPLPLGVVPGSVQPDAPVPTESETPRRPAPVWGYAGIRGFGLGDHVAPNGVEFKPLFDLEMDFNFWLCRSQGVYVFVDATFWGQRAAPGITNASQGPFDFSKRELDLSGGVAWNYTGPFEARVFAYSSNNLNRGNSATAPSGYNDGFALENRWYINDAYRSLGLESYDVPRAAFISLGYYPTKDLVDGEGVDFKPGPFAHAYLVLDLLGENCYLYSDLEMIATRSFTPKLLTLDAGIAVRPWDWTPRVEFRLGTDDMYDLSGHDTETGLYGSVRIVY